jgi:hypothetical protein
MPKEKIDPNLAWLIANKKYIKIRNLEKELKMPEGTLNKFIIGARSLPEDWHAPVIKRVKELRK